MTGPTLVPMTLKEARRYVGRHHSHNEAPTGGLFATAVELDGEVIGVGIAARPDGRWNDGRAVLDIARVCVGAHVPNACSQLYAALRKAGAALGYRPIVTYTQASECSACVRAAGFRRDTVLPERDPATGQRAARQRLFDDRRRPSGPLVRWVWP